MSRLTYLAKVFVKVVLILDNMSKSIEIGTKANPEIGQSFRYHFGDRLSIKFDHLFIY